MARTRMYEPWGYQDENNYQGAGIILENDLDSFFANVSYNRDDNKIHFANKDGEEKGTLDVSEFVKSDTIVEYAKYEDGKIIIKFTNGDIITIDVEELLDENEFKDGFQVNEGQVSVLIDGESDDYLSVSANGVKVAGVKADIEAEQARAEGEEQRIEAKLDQEIADRIADVDEEEARAIAEEQRIDSKLDQEIADRIADVDEEETRATTEETTIKNTIGGGFSTASTETVTVKFNDLATALDTEIGNRTTQDNQLQNNINTESTARQAADTRLENLITDERNRAVSAETALNAKIDQEIADRIADVNEEEARAIAAEQALQNAIDDETARAISAETALDEKINQEIADREADVNEEEARATSAETTLDAKIDQEVADREADVDAEEARALSAETELQSAIESEGQRAQDAETALEQKIDAETARAISAETELAEGIEILGSVKFDDAKYDSSAKTINFYAEEVVIASIDATDFIKDGMIKDVRIENGYLVIDFNTDSGIEDIQIPLTDIFNPDNYYDKNAIDAIVSGINESISNEVAARAENDETLSQSIEAEKTRAEGAETALQDAIDANAEAISAEETARIAADEAQDAVIAIKADASAVTEDIAAAVLAEENRATDVENGLSDAIGLINDAIDLINDTKFDDVEYDSSAKTINFIADGAVVKELDATPFIKDGMIDDVKIEGGNLVIIFNTDSGKEEIDIPLTEIFDPANYYTKSEVDSAILAEETRAKAEEDLLGAEIDSEIERAISAETDLASAIELKADKETTYTQSEVDALIKAKETEIYNLTKIVGDMGGAVTYTLPNELGTSFNSLMNNNGTVKLTEDVTTGRFGPGIIAKNKVTLNLNGKDLTVTGLTETSAQGAIMSRGTQEITITGSTATTINSGKGICIEANGKDSVINLVGKTTYETNRPGGELIYCYAGTINISAGTFKNNGSQYLLNCYDANYAAGTAKIIVTGGSFYDFNPADNSAEGEHTSFVPEGYHVDVTTDGESTVYTVKKNS